MKVQNNKVALKKIKIQGSNIYALIKIIGLTHNLL